MEQQLKLYAESLQSKLDDIERTGIIPRVPDNSESDCRNKATKSAAKIVDLEDTINQLSDKLKQL